MTDAFDPAGGALEIARDVFVFTSGAFAMTSGAVLGRAEGAGPRAALLIDPGFFPAELERIARLVRSGAAEASRIVLTHSDWDHVAGGSRWPGVLFVTSSEFPRRVAAERERIERSLAEFDRKLYVRRDPPFAMPAPGALVGSPSDLVWSGPPAHLLPARGHTPDGLLVLLRENGVLFAGDHLSDREIPFVGDSIGSYAATLDAVRGLVRAGRVETLVPGHGDVCARDEILSRVEEDADYLARLDAWVRDTHRSVESLEGILERCDEVVFRKGWDNPDVRAEHRANVRLLASQLGIT